MNKLKTILVMGASSEVGLSLLKDMEQIYTGCAEKPLILAHFGHDDTELIKLKNNSKNLNIVTIKTDLSSAQETEDFLTQIENYGCPDAIVYLPAGKLQYMKIKELEWQQMETEMRIQVGGLAKLGKKILPLMAKKHHGKVVIMLTECTIGIPPKYMCNYVTVKYAQMGLMKAMASEYGSKGININGISPAMMETKFLSNIDERIIAMNAENNVMKRNILPSEVVKSIEYLLSGASDYMSGVNLNLSGGNR